MRRQARQTILTPRAVSGVGNAPCEIPHGFRRFAQEPSATLATFPAGSRQPMQGDAIGAGNVPSRPAKISFSKIRVNFLYN